MPNDTKCPYCQNDDRTLIEVVAALLGRIKFHCGVCSRNWEVLKDGVINKV